MAFPEVLAFLKRCEATSPRCCQKVVTCWHVFTIFFLDFLCSLCDAPSKKFHFWVAVWNAGTLLQRQVGVQYSCWATCSSRSVCYWAAMGPWLLLSRRILLDMVLPVPLLAYVLRFGQPWQHWSKIWTWESLPAFPTAACCSASTIIWSTPKTVQGVFPGTFQARVRLSSVLKISGWWLIVASGVVMDDNIMRTESLHEHLSLFPLFCAR